ncbi:MAG: glycosyltransferase family 39 protein [Chloroflexia bacterium]|nr:glycosyltransferase family 39 protein [Chloroflexia bacterium]
MIAIRRGLRAPAIDAWLIALLVVLLAAFAVRLYGIEWDDGADLHPDELFIAKIVLIDRIHLEWPLDGATMLDPERSGLNPRAFDPATGKFREFAYGALPLFVTDGAAWLLSRFTGANWNSIDRVYLVGRALSAGFSAMTVLPIAALGSAVGGRSVGLLAALFAALAPMSIQLAHFFTTDSWLTFFVALGLLTSLNAANAGGTRQFIAAGAVFGLAMATKSSAFALVVPLLAALVIDLRRRLAAGMNWPIVRHTIAGGIATAVAAILAFLVFEPFALLRPNGYLYSLRVQADIANGVFDVPFTRVYAGTVPLLYQLEQFLRWGYGPPTGILAIAGIALLIPLALRRMTAAVILMCWFAAYGAVILVSDVKFLRYLEPLAPVFAVAAAVALSRLIAFVADRRPAIVRHAILAVILGLTIAWTAAFLSIYAHEHPRLAASRWIYHTIPPGSNLTAEYWDDALPRTLGFALSPASFGFGSISLDLYRDLPPPQASDAIFADLSAADFVVQSSQRVAAAIAAAPWRYPVQGRFFAQLEAGALAFDRVATFARPPNVGNVSIDDSTADESFINYDHPRVSIYVRAGPESRRNYDAAMAWALQRPWHPVREPPQSTLLLDGPVGENPAVVDARWSAALSRDTPWALAIWVLLLVVMLAVGRPIAALLLSSFPDRGWGLARTLALVLAAYPVWLGASLELFRFRALWSVVALAAIGAVGWRLLHPKHSVAKPQTPGPGSRAWIHAEAAFWVVFLLFLGFRMITPDGWHPFWGGEKPMEFAQINAIQRSAYFPPYDPWFADGYVNYYYYGFYLMAFLFKATGIPSEIGFNLALPTVMGLVASGGFSVAAALSRGITRSPRLALLGGWLGAVFLCLMGNLSAVRGLLSGPAAAADPFLAWTWSGSRAIDNAITEFPYFSGLYADLHAHVIALPITLATIAFCYAIATDETFARPDSQVPASGTRSVFAAQLVILSLLLGSLSATNAWDVPVYAALAVASVFMATASSPSLRARLARFAALSILVIGGAWVLFLPFHLHFVALFGQLALVQDPTDLLQFLSHLGGLLIICALGFAVLVLRGNVRGGGAPIAPWLALGIGVIGLLTIEAGTARLATIGAVLIILACAGPPVAAAWFLLDRTPADHPWPTTLLRGALVAVVLASVAIVFSGRPVFALLLALGLVAALAWLGLRRPPERFVCLVLTAGFLTAAGAEILIVADDLIGTPAYRMNTVFKFYNQVWVLLAVAAAALATAMVQTAARRHRLAAATRPTFAANREWAKVGVGICALVILASLTYPIMATGPRLAQRFTPGTPSGTLNALGWMTSGTVPVSDDPAFSQLGFAGDAAAIDWLLANVSGSPVIAEASIGPYRCNGSRISAATGLPTIIGWERHEQQQRYPDTLPGRVADVRTLFTSGDIAEKVLILRRYNVAYVIVGDVERVYPIANNECSPTGTAAGIAAFDAMVGSTLEVAHSSGGTTIYRVLPLGAS